VLFKKFNCYKSVILFLFLVVSLSSMSQSRQINDFYRFIDSADVYVSENPYKAQSYLDSITEPISSKVKGRLAEYYQLKGLVNDELNEEAKKFQNFILALKYAKLEENYAIAGMSSLELFYNTLIIKNDTTAFEYLEEAKTYFTLDNNTNGLAEVMQMPAYVELYHKNYDKSNLLVLEHLEDYKNINDDGYYYMYALFMLSSNYTHLYDLQNAHKYLYLLKGLKSDKTISPSLHASHLVTVYNDLANEHLKKKASDSSLVYLLEASKLGKYMNYADKENHYNFYINYYESVADVENKKNYIDSLNYLHKQKLEKTIDASIQINEELLKSENQLSVETEKSKINRYYILALIIALIILFVLFTIRNKIFEKKIKKFNSRDKEYSYLQSNHEKLKLKISGLESYMNDVKKEIKDIAIISDTAEQKNQIKNLYKNIHHNSSIILNKEEKHLELINALNVSFFNKINSKHPELNHSEVIICYYILTGFKNKEIAAFLNTSERAVESKRYRISKKLNLKEKGITLVDYLQDV
jgi:DNA-binding CsgD family transcriptional regulator